MAATTASTSAFFLLVLTLLAMIASLVSASPHGIPTSGDTLAARDGVIVMGLGRPLRYNDTAKAHKDTSLIDWGRQSSKLIDWTWASTINPDDDMPRTNCFGGHGISDVFFDNAVAKFCEKANGLILDLKNTNNSVAMTYAYWPPARYGGKDPYDCGDTGQVYLHIGFGLGAPSEIKYTLTTAACVRGLQTVYNVNCDGAHVDNKHGGQLDLGTYQPKKEDQGWNDHLFYLADPNPPLEGRNPYCSNGFNRFVPNAANTNTLPKETDLCYDAHLGFGGDDKWDVTPAGYGSWSAFSNDKAHDTAKDACTKAGGKYDKRGGTADNWA